MLKKIGEAVARIEDKKWIIVAISAGIAVAAAAISIIVYFGKKEEEVEEDCYAEE